MEYFHGGAWMDAKWESCHGNPDADPGIPLAAT